MTYRTDSGRTSRSTGPRSETVSSTQGLTNARTRIVGDRTGAGADAVVGIVRLLRLARERVGAHARRAASVVTPLGWTALAAVPAAFLAGYGFGLQELVVVAWLGLVLLVVGALYLIGRLTVDVDLDLPAPRVTVGDPAEGEVIVRNPARRAILGLTVEIPVGRGLAELALPGLRGGAEARRRFVVPTARRGVIELGPVRSVRADPIGLVRREVVWAGSRSLYVHPHTIAIPSTSTGFIRDLEGSPTRDLSSADVSFHALREYSPGDDRRYIHWKSTAKTGTYMVRQFEETRRSHLVVALSLATGDYATDEEFELAVSAAASLGARAIRDTRTLSVVASERTPEFAKRKVFAVRTLSTVTRTRLLDDLAGVEQAESALGVVDLARVTATKIGGVSVAFLVCGSLPTPAQLRTASAFFPIGVEVVAIVCDPDTVPGLRQVAGLRVLTIGYLADLQKALARSAAT